MFLRKINHTSAVISLLNEQGNVLLRNDNNKKGIEIDSYIPLTLKDYIERPLLLVFV